ncbi:MAG TPA: esterase-like activity of phytase family protein [Candidatus Binatia bacterium]
MGRQKINLRTVIILLVSALFLLVPYLLPTPAKSTADPTLVELFPIDVDPKHPERRKFDSLTLLSAFHLQSKDRRFGGLSGMSIGADGKLYAISDRGYWLSATMVTDADGALSNLVDWRIAPMLTTTKTPVSGRWRDAEALARTRDGSFLVGFEGAHRLWRYPAPPETFQSSPSPAQIPPAVSRAPSNGGIEGLAILPDGRLLALTEEFENPDGSFKGWLIDNGRFAELSYVPAKGFRVTDCAALDNGDVLVLERRYVLVGILSARVTLVKAGSLKPRAKLAGKELLKLEQPLAVDNFEGLAVQKTPQGTMIFIVSDDNYSSFQQTLLLQFLLSNNDR